MPVKNSWQALWADVYLDKFILSNPGASGHKDAFYRTSALNSRITSANLPDWKARISAGLDASTTLYGTRRTLRLHPGKVTGWVLNSGKRDTWIVSGDIGYSNVSLTPNAPSGPVVDQARTASQVAFTKNYRSKTRNWSSGVFCGELLETARLLASPVRALRKGVDELHSQMVSVYKKSRNQSAKKTADAVAGAYLGWVFGVQPLISDADSAAEAFRALASGRTFDMIRITGVGTAEALVHSSSQAWHPSISEMVSSSNDWRGDRQIFDRVQVTTRGAWRNDNPSGEMPLPMRFGTTLSDVVPTAWELIPWSFLADYFVNIGDVLDAWSMRFVTFAWMNQTTRSRRTDRISDCFFSPTGGVFHFTGSGGHAAVNRFDVQRIPTAANAWDNNLMVKIPGWGSTKWLNISALALLKKRPLGS